MSITNRRTLLAFGPLLIAVALIGFVAGRATRAAPHGADVHARDAGASQEFRAEIESIAAERDRLLVALSACQSEQDLLRGQLQERTSAFWDLVAEYVQRAVPAASTAPMNPETAWVRGFPMIEGGIFKKHENAEPWLFYEPLADAAAYAIEIARQGERGVLFLENIVARPLPQPEAVVAEGENGETGEMNEGAVSDESNDKPRPEDKSTDEDATNAAEWLRKERESAIEFLGELASPDALAALLRLRRQFPDDEALALTTIGNHVEHMADTDILPYLPEILRQCRDTLNAGRDDRDLPAVTAYLAFQRHMGGAMALLRSSAMLTRDCVNAANIAADAHSDIAYQYLVWLSRATRHDPTRATSSTHLANWDN